MFHKDKNQYLLFATVSLLLLILTACTNKPQTTTDTTLIESIPPHEESQNLAVAESIEAVYRDICAQAVPSDTLDSLETMQSILDKLGERGYTAVDSENQLDMTQAQQVMQFCESVNAKKNAELTIIVLTNTKGFTKYDLKTSDGSVDIVRGYYQYENGHLENKSTFRYPADVWQYTDEGYLLFGGNWFSDESYVLTLSDTTEYSALRVQPLDEKCRELNRKYVRPIGYEKNNLFLVDWNEEDFGAIDFYDLFDRLYPILYQQPVPYTADENINVGAVYQIPTDAFETVIKTFVKIDSETLQSKTAYSSENKTYTYKPRGFYELDNAEVPYPEVVHYTENADGTVSLTVNAVYPNGCTANAFAFSHKVVIRPLGDGSFSYVSNQVLTAEEDYDTGWHSPRLTATEWEEFYAPMPVDTAENETLSSLFPQAENCLITETEKKTLEKEALAVVEQVKEVYKDVEIGAESIYSSNIKDFTIAQCKEVVALLGKAGFVSVTEDTNMENYEALEDFYTAYMQRRDAMVTVFQVNRDGLIGAVTFVYREDKLQTYYVGIRWKTGGVPQVMYTLVSDVAEMKLTEKGYFIYAYETLLEHSSACRYWRIKPLSAKCREFTKTYLHGLSYVNYNMLVTNWDSSNVEDILMPCMFEDIYRMDTGETLRAENGTIPADVYERMMTTYFPVSKEQLRDTCGYDADSDTYPYEMIYPSPYAPFGEVVDYTENADGTLTLFADGVWCDYNSDCAFTNEIVVQPFSDGTFRYLSNKIEQKELELPPVAFRAE